MAMRWQEERFVARRRLEDLCPLISATLATLALVETPETGFEGASEKTLSLEHLELFA